MSGCKSVFRFVSVCNCECTCICVLVSVALHVYISEFVLIEVPRVDVLTRSSLCIYVRVCGDYVFMNG